MTPTPTPPRPATAAELGAVTGGTSLRRLKLPKLPKLSRPPVVCWPVLLR